MIEGLSRRRLSSLFSPPKAASDGPRSKRESITEHDVAAERALEFVAFDLPPEVDWETFNDDPRRTWCGLFLDPAVEATFLRFKARPGCFPMIALTVGGAVYNALHYFSPAWGTYVKVALAKDIIVAFLIIVLVHFQWDAPFEAYLRWRDRCKKKEVKVVKPVTAVHSSSSDSDLDALDPEALLAIKIAETRAAFAGWVAFFWGAMACSICAAFIHELLWHWCTVVIPPRPGLDITTLCHWRILISAGAASVTALRLRTPFAAVVALGSFSPYIYGYAFGFGIPDLLSLLGHCMTNVPLVIGTMYQVHAVDVQDRRFFQTVVGAHCARRAIARHVRGVAATAAAAAPRFAAAQLRGVTVLRGLGRLPSLDLSLTTVGITGVADFARWVTGLLPVNVVVSLHALFAAYDAAAARHGVDKLGTFGDTYAVSAQIRPRSSSAAGSSSKGVESSSSSVLEESDEYGLPSPDVFGAAARRVAGFVMWQVRVGIAAGQPPGAHGTVAVAARGAVCSGALSCGVIGSAAALRFAATGRSLADARMALEAAPPGAVHIDEATAAAFGAPGEAQTRGFSLFESSPSVLPEAESLWSSATASSGGIASLGRGRKPSPAERGSVGNSGTSAETTPETDSHITSSRGTHASSKATQRSGFDYKAYVAEASKRFALVQHWGTTQFSDPTTERRAAIFAREESRIIVPRSAFAVAMLYAMTASVSLYELLLYRCDFTARLRSVGGAAPFTEAAQRDSLQKAVLGGWGCLLNGDAYPLFPVVLMFFAAALELRRWCGHGVLDTRHAVFPFLVWIGGIYGLPKMAVAAKTVQYSLGVMNQAPHWLPQTTGSVWPRAGIHMAVSLLMLAVHILRGATVAFNNEAFLVWVLCTSTAYVVQTRRSVRVRYQLTEHASTLHAVATRYRETQDRLARALLPPHVRDAALSGLQPRHRASRVSFALSETMSSASEHSHGVSVSGLGATVGEASSYARHLAHPPPQFSDCLLFPVPDVVVLHMSLRPRVIDRGLGGFQESLSYGATHAAAATVQALAQRWEQLLHLAGVGPSPDSEAFDSSVTELAESQDALGDLLGDSNDAIDASPAEVGSPQRSAAAARVLERQRRQAAQLRNVEAAGGRPSAAARRYLEGVEAFGDEVVFAGPFPHGLGGQHEADVVLAAHAAVDLCRRASTALARPLGPGDQGMVFVAGLGAGSAQAALLGNSRLTYRLLGVSRREASALLAAAPLPQCGAHSAAFASPAFRRAHEGYGGHIAVSRELMGPDGCGGASRAVRGSVCAATRPTEATAAPAAGEEGSAFGDPALWRVRGLGVMQVATVRGL